MGRRRARAEEPPPGLPAWMATFSDLVTLLLTFFVMLTAMANFEDVQRVDAVFKSIRDALGVGGYDIALLDTSQAMLTDAVQHRSSAQPLVSRLRHAMSRHVSDDLVRVTSKPHEIHIRLDEKVFFAPGSATLHPASYAFVGDVAEVLATEQVEIRVEGYTDASGEERKNWVLSGTRAIEVAMALRSRGPIDGERIEAVAMGSFRPGADSSWNRRIELVLTSKGAGAQHAAEILTSGEQRE